MSILGKLAAYLRALAGITDNGSPYSQANSQRMPMDYHAIAKARKHTRRARKIRRHR
jgi:hypothetical protein